MSKRKFAGTDLSVSGSERHVSKTNGSHNGRWDRFPHVTDALDRPRKLGGEAVSKAPRWKNGKVRWSQRRINPFNYQDPMKGIEHKRALYHVQVVFQMAATWLDDYGVLKDEIISVRADCALEAEDLAYQIVDEMHVCEIKQTNIVALD